VRLIGLRERFEDSLEFIWRNPYTRVDDVYAKDVISGRCDLHRDLT
jgi:hypothetical protein